MSWTSSFTLADVDGSRSTGGADFAGPVANVRDYGAIGDGQHNDGPAIRDAINLSPSHTLLFPRGVYLVKKEGSFPGSITFEKTLSNTNKPPLQLVFLEGAVLRPGPGVALRIPGSIQAPTSRIFDEQLTSATPDEDDGVHLKQNDRIQSVYAEWWGATGNDPSDDDAYAINRALEEVGKVGKGVLVGLSTRYDIESPLTVFSNTTWVGQNAIGDSHTPYHPSNLTVYNLKSNTSTESFEGPVVQNHPSEGRVEIRIKRMVFKGNFYGGTRPSASAQPHEQYGVHLVGASWSSLEDVAVQRSEGHGIHLSDSSSIRLVGVRSKYNGMDGIRIENSGNVRLDHVNCEDNEFGNGVSIVDSRPMREFTSGPTLIESIWLEDNGGSLGQTHPAEGSGLVLDGPNVVVLGGRASNSRDYHLRLGSRARSVQIIGFEPRPTTVPGEPAKRGIHIDPGARGITIIGVSEHAFVTDEPPGGARRFSEPSHFPDNPESLFVLHDGFLDTPASPDPVPDELLMKVTGDTSIVGSLYKSAGGFRIRHPTKAGHELLHSFVESPKMLNLYDGTVTLDAKGEARVRLPRWFTALNASCHYQLTPLGAASPGLHVATQVDGSGTFSIAGGVPSSRVSWQVTGVRKDEYANERRIEVERKR